MAADIEASIEDIKRLKLRPDEILVFRFKGTLSADYLDNVQTYLNARFPDLKSIVIDDTVSLEVLSREIPDASPED